jgi:hypothetical protein|tara:strand:- start:3382 stop:3597 length:216 start_codon:yes stop_codon:yes gene_type:complete
MEDTTVVLALSSVISFMCLLVGGLIGWIARENHYQKPGFIHPEFLDEHGNLLPDDILAVTFVNDPPETEED